MIVLLENVRSLKSVNPVVPELVGFTLVNAAPAAVYPVPEISLVELYAVVAAPKVALDV